MMQTPAKQRKQKQQQQPDAAHHKQPQQQRQQPAQQPLSSSSTTTSTSSSLSRDISSRLHITLPSRTAASRQLYLLNSLLRYRCVQDALANAAVNLQHEAVLMQAASSASAADQTTNSGDNSSGAAAPAQPAQFEVFRLGTRLRFHCLQQR